MKAKIIIPHDVHQKIMRWVHKANFEVSGFGTVIFDSAEQTFTVEDAFLVKQEGSAAATDICAKDLGKAMFEAHKRKLKGTINFWWHSHVNMEVFWSGTDRSTIEDLGKNGWIIATVFNKREEMRSAFATRVDVPLLGPRIEFQDEFPTEILTYFDQTLIDQWDKDFQDNVQEKTWKQPVSLTSTALQYSGNYDFYSDWNEEAWNKNYSPKPTRFDNQWEPETPEQKQALRAEAKLLGLSYGKYLNTLNFGSIDDLDKLEQQLELLRGTK